jgi:hypothetical protein
VRASWRKIIPSLPPVQSEPEEKEEVAVLLIHPVQKDLVMGTQAGEFGSRQILTNPSPDSSDYSEPNGNLQGERVR